MSKILRFLVVTVLATFGIAQQALAVTFLPDPNLYAVRYDDFYSYSAKLLTAFGLSGFDGPVGVGGLDVVIGTHAAGQDNDPVSGGFQFPDPLATPAGGGAGSDVFSPPTPWGGFGAFSPVLVDDLLAYLHSISPIVNIPVFNFDQSQNVEKDLFANGFVRISDPNGVIADIVWAFDSITNNQFDPAAFVLSPGTITATNPLFPFESETVDNNTGSGKNDFIIYAPTMDLSLFAGQGLRFSAFFAMNHLDGGGEDLFLTGQFAPNPIPEPATMTLLGIGAMGAAFMRRRNKKTI